MTMKKIITIIIIVITIAAIWARTNITNAANTIKEVKQEYISTGETLWDIYLEKSTAIQYQKFCYEVQQLNGKTVFNAGETILIPVH
jgi:hypothetical protein